MKWKGANENPDGDFYVRSGPGTVKLKPEDIQPFISTRFHFEKSWPDRTE
ncbi:hypothetical protein L0222_05600 [bacterium]|nr:hypothetical protein [bacterium]